MEAITENIDDNEVLRGLLSELVSLRGQIVIQAQEKIESLSYKWPNKNKLYSANNLCGYIVFRKYNISPLQLKLEQEGLSSLGRGESNILDNLDRVIGCIEQMLGTCCAGKPEINHDLKKFAGRDLLKERTNKLFGKVQGGYKTRIMTTLPTEAATDDNFISDLIESGTNCVRINCAHDTEKDWLQMIDKARASSEQKGVTCNVFMDLSGVKIRTGQVGAYNKVQEKILLFEGDEFEIRSDAKISVAAGINPLTKEIKPHVIAADSDSFITKVKTGHSVWIDDGKLGAVVDHVFDHGIKCRVTHAGPKGVRIKAKKGINFPESKLDLPLLTKKDIQDLEFICKHADMVGLSFVNSANDLDEIIKELDDCNVELPIVAKIETRSAIENLPSILLKGLSYPGQFAVMIARGDLAVELGSVRMAEIQEEILWLCEAAHVPVIWATQVLETLAKKGTISRPEITDAAMSVRAECVMLNKGKYINSAVIVLRDILDRMEMHQYKKISKLHPLQW